MFAGQISRANGCPWGPLGMTSAKWLHVPVETVEIGSLIATQDGVYFHGLAEQAEPYGPDSLPHVIEWRGARYLEDGHHRAVRAVLRGERTLEVRLLRVKDVAA